MSEAGRFPFNISAQATASSILRVDERRTDTITVEAVTLTDLVDDLGWDGIDLLKCDIEGAEVELLQKAPESLLRGIRQISVEFHDFIGFTPRSDVEATIRRLEGLGFRSVRMSRVGHQDTWMINRELCPITDMELLYIERFVRNWQGARRVAGRVLKRLGLRKE
jgi:hypothetical protein